MVSVKDITPLILGGAALYIVSQSGILAGFRGIGEGAEEAAVGIGAGVGTAFRGVGAGVEDIFSLLGPLGAFGETREARIQREFGQEAEVDIAAHEQARQELAQIQAQEQMLIAEQEAERERLSQERQTERSEAVSAIQTGVFERFARPSLLKFWQYSPLGLLQSFIQGQASIETSTPSVSVSTSEAGIITGSAVSTAPTAPTPIITSTGVYATKEEARAVYGGGFEKIGEREYIPVKTIYLEPAKPSIVERAIKLFKPKIFPIFGW